MAHAVRGLLFLSVYSGGFSAVCLICYFNAPVRCFNVWGYTYTAAVQLALFPLFIALWRGVVHCAAALSSAPWIAACAASLPPSMFPWCLVGGCTLLRRCGLGWIRRPLLRAWRSAKVAGKVAGKVVKVAKVAGIVVRLRAKVAGIVAVKVAAKVAGGCAKVARFAPKS